MAKPSAPPPAPYLVPSALEEAYDEHLRSLDAALRDECAVSAVLQRLEDDAAIPIDEAEVTPPPRRRP